MPFLGYPKWPGLRCSYVAAFRCSLTSSVPKKPCSYPSPHASVRSSVVTPLSWTTVSPILFTTLFTTRAHEAAISSTHGQSKAVS